MRRAVVGVGAGELHPEDVLAALADGVIADELDANTGERSDELHERVDVAADHVLARLHTLDRRHGQARQLGELSLVNTQEGTRRPQLS